jgi:hypothetical protein
MHKCQHHRRSCCSGAGKVRGAHCQDLGPIAPVPPRYAFTYSRPLVTWLRHSTQRQRQTLLIPIRGAADHRARCPAVRTVVEAETARPFRNAAGSVTTSAPAFFWVTKNSTDLRGAKFKGSGDVQRVVHHHNTANMSDHEEGLVLSCAQEGEHAYTSLCIL